jgi:hypothetical protein
MTILLLATVIGPSGLLAWYALFGDEGVDE